MMRHLDLFSGIGGFALAARMAGEFKTVAFCEIDKYCQRVLRKNFPNVPINDNVKTLNGNEYGPIDIITGGYPCQPFSIAGKRSGANDDRHLWPEVFRIARSIKPRWLLLENVAGHITLGLDDVLFDLDSIGYTAQPFVIPACAVDARHRRDRVWIIAHDSRQHLPQPQVADSERIFLSELGGTADKAMLRVAEWEADQPSMVGVAHGIPNWVDRARGLGNAIVPQVAAVILSVIRETDQYFYQS